MGEERGYKSWSEKEKKQFREARVTKYSDDGGRRILELEYYINVEGLPKNHPARRGYNDEDIRLAVSASIQEGIRQDLKLFRKATSRRERDGPRYAAA